MNEITLYNPLLYRKLEKYVLALTSMSVSRMNATVSCAVSNDLIFLE